MLSLVAVYIQNRKCVLGIITSKKKMNQTFLKTIAKLTFIPITIIRYITSLNDIWKSRIINEFSKEVSLSLKIQHKNKMNIIIYIPFCVIPEM